MGWQRITHRTASEWTAGNYTLLNNELGVESDTQKQKLGDGTTTWTSLGYNTPNAGTFTGLVTAQAGLTVTGGVITAPTGTATIANLNTPAGVVKTASVAGDHEYDGVASYITNDTTSGRGIVEVDQYFRLDANGSTISTIANFFGANSNISLVASGYYLIEIYAWFLNTTANTMTWSLINSAAPTSQNIFYEMSPIAGVVAPPGTATALTGQFVNDNTASKTFNTGSLTDAVNHYAHFKIWLKNGTGTSLKIQATKNVGGTITPLVGSFWMARRLPSSSVGNFAA